jgi:hypothetical protein
MLAEDAIRAAVGDWKAKKEAKEAKAAAWAGIYDH